MKFSKQSLTILTVVAVLGFLFFIAFYFWQDFSVILGITTPQSTVKSLVGQPINFTAEAKALTIPPVYSEDILSYLKKELNEKGGLPYTVGKKGNFLPFGIP